MKAHTILILCFLGDPTLPAGSLAGTGGFNASVKDLLDFIVKTHTFNCIFITNTTGNYTESSIVQISSNVMLYRLFSPAIHLLQKNNYTQEIENFQNNIEYIIKDFSNIAFIHSFYWLSGLIANTLSEKYQIPFIHTTVSLSMQKMISGYTPDINHQFEYENAFLHKAKYILAITEEEKRVLIEYYNIDDKKIIVEGQNIANEYHTPLYDNYGIPQSISQTSTRLKPVGFNELNVSDGNWWNYGAFTYVGRINQTKGVDIIIKAWIELDKRFEGKIPPLWLIGNTPYEIEHFRNEIGISTKLLLKYEQTKRIIWWGYLNPTAISTLYLKTAVLVTHSAFEGGGRVILEALCQGIPVISTNTGFGKDYIIDWLNGFIVNYMDIEMLMLRMSHFVTNPMLSSVLGENAKKCFQVIEANWNRNTRINNLYCTLISNSNYSNAYISNITLDNNMFEKGCITTYPYYYHKPTVREITDFASSCIKEVVFIPSKFEQISSFDLWKYNREYVIKNIYPKLNKRKLWDYSETFNVWSTYEIIKKYTYSIKSHVILSPINMSSESLLIIFPYMEMLSCREIEKNVYKIAKCLKLFSELPLEKDNVIGISFVSYWRNLQQYINRLKFSNIANKLKRIPPAIKCFLNNPQNFTGKMCIQYAQPPLGHVGILKNKIFLLPTYHWKYSQEGLDAGLLFYQVLFSMHRLCPTTTLSVLHYFSSIWELPEKQILGWTLCICIENMICDLIFSTSKQYLIDKVYIHLINLFDTLI